MVGEVLQICSVTALAMPTWFSKTEGWSLGRSNAEAVPELGRPSCFFIGKMSNAIGQRWSIFF